MKRGTHSLVVAYASTLLLPSVASADWIVRLGGAWVEPAGSFVDVGSIGEFELDSDGPVVAGDITWLFNEHIGIELWGSEKFNRGVDFLPTATGESGERGVGEDLRKPQ
jgi:hypothetical protein